jgi:EAL domain-containing protein (putative c-di-GMP-specific phosphodiesterase class I)
MKTLDLPLLAQAIKDGNAVPFFQPIIREEEHIISYEVLGRMRIDGEIAMPGQFLPLLDNTPHQRDFDRAITIGAIRKAAQWQRDTNTRIHLHVNASKETLEDQHYASFLREMLYTYEIAPDSFAVEILETCSVFWENDLILNTLREIRATGIQIAIDDFPTCEEPENLLRWMHAQKIGDFHVLKIDRSLVQASCQKDEARAEDAIDEIMDYTDFAHEHGMRVVAEGVETERELTLMRDLGADEFQGFAIGRPQSSEKAYHLYGSRGFVFDHTFDELVLSAW